MPHRRSERHFVRTRDVHRRRSPVRDRDAGCDSARARYRRADFASHPQTRLLVMQTESVLSWIDDAELAAISSASFWNDAEKEKEKPYHVTYVPELDNISTYGKTREQALTRTKALILAYVETSRDLGYRLPLSKARINTLVSSLKR